MYQRIFVPVDGSEASNRGLSEAIRFAKEQRAALRLVHVVDHTMLPKAADGASAIPMVLDAMRQNGRRVLDAAVKAAKAEGLEAEPLIQENIAETVADVIIDQVERWPADLVVMGTHGRKGVSHFFMGSDAEAVVRMSPVPVLLVRSDSVNTPSREAKAAKERAALLA